MTSPFPHRYEISVEHAPRHAARVTAPPRPVILGGPPPQFDGNDEWWSPEHLLLSSAALCFAMTFDSFARRAQWPYDSLRCDAVGVLDKTPEGFRFVEILLNPVLKSSGDPEKGRALLESAKKHCIVANSLKAEVRLSA